MGCFSYICNKCGLNIRENERVVLKHVRHGEILGETIGTYDSYGRVYEDPIYRSRKEDEKSHLGINSHEEICKSEFSFEDSIGANYNIHNEEDCESMDVKSGTVAFHAKCYCSLKDTHEHNALKKKPSKLDPKQGCENPRKRFL